MRERSEGSIGFFLVVVPWSGSFSIYDFIKEFIFLKEHKTIFFLV